MNGTLSVGPVPSSGLVRNESGKAIGRFQTHGAEITAEIGDAVLRCSEASQALAVMIGRQAQRTMAERKRSAAGRTEGVSCEAECKISCEDVVFEESPDKFSTQKCKDYGGVGAYSGGKFLCKAWRRDASRVFGYGQMTHEAQKAAAEPCQARPAPCGRPMHKATSAAKKSRFPRRSAFRPRGADSPWIFFLSFIEAVGASALPFYPPIPGGTRSSDQFDAGRRPFTRSPHAPPRNVHHRDGRAGGE